MSRSTNIIRHIVPLLLASTAWSGSAAAQLLTGTVVDALANLDTRVTLADGKIAVIEGKVVAAASAATALDSAVRSLTAVTTTQATAIAALTAQASATASAATEIDAKLQTQGGSLAALGDANLAMGAKVEQHAQVLGTIQGQVAAAAVANVQVATDVEKLGSDVATAGKVVTGLTGRLTGVEGMIAPTVQAVTDLDVRTTANTWAIAALDVRVGDNSAAIARERIRNDAQDVTLADHATRIDRVGAVADASMSATNTLRGDVAAGRIGVVQVGANDAFTMGPGLGGSTVSMAGTGGARRISGVSAGVQADDAATVGQVASAMTTTLASANLYTDQQLTRALDQQMGATQTLIADNSAVLRRDMNGVAAHGAALSGLPQATVPGRGFAGMSVGGKGGQVAVALGISKAFLDKHAPVLKAGAAVDTRRGDMTYNAGVGIHF